MIKKLEVPEIDVDVIVDTLVLNDPLSNEKIQVLKDVWKMTNLVYVDCLKVQRESIELLISQLDICQHNYKDLKDFFDKHPEIRMMKKQIERAENGS